MTLRAPDLRFRPPLEAFVQRGIVELFRKGGIHVGSTSQYRASHVEEGIPDLICHAQAIQTFFWFEVKTYETHCIRATGTVRFNPYDRSTWRPRPLSEKQQAFRARSLACGVKHFWGGLPQAEDALIELKLATRLPSGLFQYCLRRAG